MILYRIIPPIPLVVRKRGPNFAKNPLLVIVPRMYIRNDALPNGRWPRERSVFRPQLRWKRATQRPRPAYFLRSCSFNSLIIPPPPTLLSCF